MPQERLKHRGSTRGVHKVRQPEEEEWEAGEYVNDGCHEARSAAPAPGHVAALRSREELRSATACKDCHEFATPAFDDGAARPTSLPMQSTYSEWVAYRRAGGGETCQGCHMPQGRHVMSGAHDVDLLRGALAVAVSAGALTVTSVGVGHSFPTGDVFRHLTVEVREDGGAPGAWRVVARLGRRFDTRLDGETLLARKVETADTSLRPGEGRVVRLPAAAKSWRVRYHYGSERDERRGLVPDSALFATLAEGETHQREAVSGTSRFRTGQRRPSVAVR